MKSLQELLPPDVALATAGDNGQEALLLKGEAETVLNTSAERRRSFALGRSCARQALADLGVDSCAIPAGPRGEPLWPKGFTGSITHRGSFWAAAAAPSRACLAIGIDAELNRPLSPTLRKKVIAGTPLPTRPAEIHWETVVFSAKESTFKARPPAQGGLPGLLGIAISLDPRRQTFQARLDEIEAYPLGKINGVFATTDSMILTAALVLAPLQRSPEELALR